MNIVELKHTEIAAVSGSGEVGTQIGNALGLIAFLATTIGYVANKYMVPHAAFANDRNGHNQRAGAIIGNIRPFTRYYVLAAGITVAVVSAFAGMVGSMVGHFFDSDK